LASIDAGNKGFGDCRHGYRLPKSPGREVGSFLRAQAEKSAPAVQHECRSARGARANVRAFLGEAAAVPIQAADETSPSETREHAAQVRIVRRVTDALGLNTQRHPPRPGTRANRSVSSVRTATETTTEVTKTPSTNPRDQGMTRRRSTVNTQGHVPPRRSICSRQRAFAMPWCTADDVHVPDSENTAGVEDG
jgi:hypothetical protein